MASWSLGDIWCVEAAGGEFCRGKNQRSSGTCFFLITSILAISHPGALACKSSQELLLQDENLKDSQETPPPKPAKNNYANNSIKA